MFLYVAKTKNGQMSCPDGNRITDTCYFTYDIGYSLVAWFCTTYMSIK